MNSIERIPVNLYGKTYTLFRFKVFPGTPHEQTVTAAEHALDSLIEDCIQRNRYHEVQAVDEMYGYVLPEEIDTTNDHDIRESIEDVVELD